MTAWPRQPQAQPMGQQGMGRQPMGLLDNPLMHLGAGLLSAGGYSSMPISTGQGLASGLLSMQQAQQMALDRQMKAEESAMRRSVLEQRQAEAQAKMDAQRRQQEALPGLLAQVPEQMRPQLEALAAVDPNAAVEAAQGLFKPADLPSDVQLAQWWQTAPPEQREALAQVMNARRPVTNVTTNVNSGPSGALSVRPLSKDEGELLGVNPSGLSVDDKGKVVVTPMSDEESARRARAEAMPQILDMIGEVERLGLAVEDNWNPVQAGPLRSQFEVQRNVLASMIAKFVLGTPGAEPSIAMEEKAFRLIPDVGMLKRKDTFQATLSELRRMIEAQKQYGRSGQSSGANKSATDYLKEAQGN